MYRNGKLHSLLGWMLRKIRIIPKKFSNKSFSASNFRQVREGICLSPPPSGARGLERWNSLNIKLYKNGKLHSLLGWTLRKILIIPKKASNKSFSASNFGQKSPRRYMSIFPPEWSDDMVEKSECIFPYLYNLIFKPYHVSRPQAPLQGGGRHMPSQTFLSEIWCRKTLIWIIFLK